MDYIMKNDRVKSIEGHFEGKKGFVTRVENDQACVVFSDIWDHGIWVELNTLKRTKRYKKDQPIDITSPSIFSK